MKFERLYKLVFESSNNKDDEYLNAVERGDMEAVQRMVDEARRISRNTVDLYTAQSPEALINFDFSRVGQNEKGLAALGPAIYLLDNKKSVEYNYGKRGNVYHVGLSEDAFIIDIFSMNQDHWKEVRRRLNNIANEIGYSDYESMPDKNVSGLRDGRGPVGKLVKLLGREKARQLLVKHSIHGSREELPTNIFEYAIYKPSKIKLADPVTYDDNGQVIPLSQRFDSTKDDIRY